jgi:hypothetical protein
MATQVVKVIGCGNTYIYTKGVASALELGSWPHKRVSYRSAVGSAVDIYVCNLPSGVDKSFWL